MDFQDILNHADYNIAETKYSKTAPSVKYSSVLPPPKKVPKPNVQSENIRKFLEKKKMEEEAKAAEEKKRKEQLLALRAQNTKNNKKAKIMASRTKDNDFSKIKLTDDEIEANRKREEAIIKKNLADKVERMKARIEMEEREKLMPKKRKRKSKNAEQAETAEDDHSELYNGFKESDSDIKSSSNNIPRKNIHKPKAPPPPAFTDLLKLAEKKQFEPLALPVAKKEEEKLMTKKERKLREEELARQRRKQERLLLGENGRLPKPTSVQNAPSNKPVVIHVAKDTPKMEQESGKFKIPKGTALPPTNKNVPVRHKEMNSNLNSKSSSHSVSLEKSAKSSSLPSEQRKISKLKEESRSSLKDAEIRLKGAVPKKNGFRINPVKEEKTKIDEEALKAKLEKEIREKVQKELEEKVQKELEEKIAAKFAQFQNQFNKNNEKKPEVTVKKEPGVGNSVMKKPLVNSSKKDMERLMAMKKQAMQQKSMKPKLPEKKPFHFNPYLDPPRRLLEPQRPPPRPFMKRRIESDDEDDDDDDDDMKDFIDDSPSQNEENYSEYIKEIFKYDKNKFIDEDDDDIVETSFAEQMKEEVRSAKLGYMEDLEEERLELERQKRKKKLKK